MNIPRYVRLAGLLILLALPGCSLLDFDTGSGDRITLVNRSGEVIYYTTLELESSYLVDPIPSFAPSESPFPKLDPGASAVVGEITAYEPGDDLIFFLYAVRDVDGEEATEPVAALVHLLTVTAGELRKHNGRVVVEAL